MSVLHLSYSIRHTMCVIPLERVAGVSRIAAFQREPRLPESVLGICSYHGKTLFGMDLQGLFTQSSHVYTKSANMIISTYDNAHFAILVDSIGGIVSLEAGQRLEAGAIPPTINKDLFSAVYLYLNTLHFEPDILNLFSDQGRQIIHEYSSFYEIQ